MKALEADIVVPASEVGWALGGSRQRTFARTKFGEILFRKNKYEVPSGVYEDYDGLGGTRAQNLIRRVAVYVNERKRFDGTDYEETIRILAVGSASADGRASHNTVLAWNRAVNVGQELLTHFRPSERIRSNFKVAAQSIGEGERPEAEYLLDRSVTLYIVKRMVGLFQVDFIGELGLSDDDKIALIRRLIAKGDPDALAAQRAIGGVAHTKHALEKSQPIPTTFWESEEDKEKLERENYLNIYRDYIYRRLKYARE